MGAGMFGLEADAAFSPRFFGSQTDFGNNSVFTAMGNLIIGVPIGGTHGGNVRPYVSGGAGLMHTQIDRNNNIFNGGGTSNNDLGWDAGAGVMGYFSEHVGLRGDIRYLRDTQVGDFHFWRLGFGVTLK